MPRLSICLAGAAVAAASALAVGSGLSGASGAAPLRGAATVPAPVPAPPTLAETGLYADPARRIVAPGNRPFAPQYPLWTDGATKRRWIRLPEGAPIDASDPDAWDFPAGTRFWKEFSFAGQPVETRYIERLADGSWLFAAYRWAPDGSATLAPAGGVARVYDHGGGRAHAIPSVTDCKVCHMGAPVPVLGFSALQLSLDRDPAALHGEVPPEGALDLAALQAEGRLTGARPGPAPRIAAGDGKARAVLGYLHANCGHCHNATGPLAALGLSLRQTGAAAEAGGQGTARGLTAPIRGRVPGLPATAAARIKAGHPENSALLVRMASRVPALQMPPLGTGLADEEAIAAIRDWIAAMEEDAVQPQRIPEPEH